jgi:hypothetical protein
MENMKIPDLTIPDPEEVMDLAAKICDARNALRELETRWSALFALSKCSNTMDEIPLKPRIIQLLEKQSDDAYSASSISKMLGAKRNSVGPYLSLLANGGKIERRDRGIYGARRGVPAIPVIESVHPQGSGQEAAF